MAGPKDDGDSILRTDDQGDPAPEFDATRTDPDAPERHYQSTLRESKRYRVDGEHARGGLGIIFRAYDRQLHRTVAIKELRLGGDEAETRFQREAELTARLEHPSIVPIHEAGHWDNGQPFYAMKLVSGRPLNALLEECESPADRLALLPKLQAVAEAIAYAHSQGIIHRDIKPANILVGEYGETVVVDWGLAKEVEPHDATPAPAPAEQTGSLESDLTRVGAVMGTPAYMPPEQARGELVDERADVYALGAALYQLLSGAPPYGGDSQDDVISRVLAGPPAGMDLLATEGPQELAAICAKAMERNPWDRYATAAGFGDDLRRFLTGQLVRAHAYSVRERLWRWVRRRQSWLAAGAILVVALGVSGYALTRTSQSLPSCTVSPDALRGAWDDDIRERIRSAFRATGQTGALETFARVEERLDAYASAWRAMRQEACEATHHRGVQSASVLELRGSCLDRRRGELAALTGLLARTDNEANLDQAMRAALSLPSVDACADAEALASVAPPQDPATRAQVEAGRAALAEVRSLRRLGQIPEAYRRAQTLATEARSIGYIAFMAEAIHTRAQLETDLEMADAAAASLYEAARLAAAAHDDTLVAHSWLDLVFLYGDALGRLDQASPLLPVAEAAAARVQRDIAIQGKMNTIAGNLAFRQVDYATSKRRLETAIALLERDPKRYELDLSDAVYSVTRVYSVLGDLDAAQATAQRSVALTEQAFGTASTSYANALLELAFVYNQQRRYDEGRKLQERALDIRIRSLGPDDPQVAGDLASLAAVLIPLGQLELARTHAERALQIMDARAPQPTQWLGYIVFVLGDVMRNQGDLVGARHHYERAIDIARDTVGAEHPMTAFLFANLGLVDNAEGKHADALTRCDRSLALIDQDGHYEFDVVDAALLCRGQALMGLRRPREALDTFAPLLSKLEPAQPPLEGFAVMGEARNRGIVRFEAARALWDTDGDRARAGELARAARDDFASIGDGKQATVVDAWLRRHGGAR